ncbi:hypothetical protein CR513_57064, partial [Mucuna pruriens]
MIDVQRYFSNAQSVLQFNSTLVGTEFELIMLTRSSSSNLHKIDPEIDKTLYRLRKARSTYVDDSSSFISVPDFVNNNCTINHSDFFESNSFDSKPNISDNKSHKSE